MNAKRLPVNSAYFPEGKVGYAVGDIHGRADLLLKLLDKIEADAGQFPDLAPVAIFLGDYVDRGLHSKKVLDILLGERPVGFELHLLRGNHEQAMQQFLSTPGEGRAWLHYGGAETLISYGVKPVVPDAPVEVLATTSRALSEALPDAHRKFLEDLSPSVDMGGYFFVHAGVDPHRPKSEQTEEDFYWIRDRFLSSTRTWEKMVVHGHTPIREPYRDHRRIGIDTGAYATGRLTAVRLKGNDIAFLTVE